MTVTRSDQGSRARGLPQRKTAFGRVPLLLSLDKWDIRDTFGTTQRDRVAVRDPRPMVTERNIGPMVTLGGKQR